MVVLLNILIAQFSKSYEEETERAQINVILTRTEIILKMEQSILTRPFIRVSESLFREDTYLYPCTCVLKDIDAFFVHFTANEKNKSKGYK